MIQVELQSKMKPALVIILSSVTGCKKPTRLLTFKHKDEYPGVLCSFFYISYYCPMYFTFIVSYQLASLSSMAAVSLVAAVFEGTGGGCDGKG